MLAAGRAPIAVVSAPTGYGKTTLLAELALTAGLPVAWLTVDDSLNQVGVLIRYLAAALDRVYGVDPVIFQPVDPDDQGKGLSSDC